MMRKPDADLGSLAISPDLVPIADIRLDPAAHITVNDGVPQLLGSRCLACGTGAFPVRDACMTCGSRAVEQVTLPGNGLLYSSTTIHVSSTRPVPYSIGYVDLSDGVRILSTLRGTPEKLVPDSSVQLRVVDDTWFFAPSEAFC